MTSRTWTLAASLAAMFLAACAQPEQVIVVTATPTLKSKWATSSRGMWHRLLRTPKGAPRALSGYPTVH